MEKQYGQEEELYPWIYMLLKMAEEKKAKDSGELYTGVSIRDVHNMVKADSLLGTQGAIRKVLKKKGMGAPDIAIIDVESKNILGCVEIKPFIIGAKRRFVDLNPYCKKDMGNQLREDGANELIAQLVSHLDNCKKVIYTNGLVFYELREDVNRNIQVKEIGNLSKQFSLYKAGSKHEMSRNEWNKLIENLTEINWHDDPKTPIEQVNP